MKAMVEMTAAVEAVPAGAARTIVGTTACAAMTFMDPIVQHSRSSRRRAGGSIRIILQADMPDPGDGSLVSEAVGHAVVTSPDS